MLCSTARSWVARRRKHLTLESTPDCKVIMGSNEPVSQAAKIGQVANAIGLSIDAIRFYEKQGLLKRSPRTEGGFRLISTGDIETLKFIRKAQELGFSLNQIRELLILRADHVPACSHVKELLDQKLTAVEQKITELRSLELSLKRALRKCKRELKTTAPGHANCCPVLEEITRAARRETKHEN